MFAGRIAVVTGGGSGIGAQTCLKLAQHGARVAVVDLTLPAAERVAAEIRATGQAALALAADVSSAADIDRVFAAIESEFGGLDLAVNCAGIASSDLPLVEQSEAAFDRIVAVNLKGVWLCLRRELALMQARGGGAVVNVASALGLIAMPNGADYVCAKHGVVGLSKAAALDVAAQNIRVNAICPGVVTTPLTNHATSVDSIAAHLRALHPIGRLGEPHEIAEAIVWLLSPQASFITGAAIQADGGWATH